MGVGDRDNKFKEEHVMGKRDPQSPYDDERIVNMKKNEEKEMSYSFRIEKNDICDDTEDKNTDEEDGTHNLEQNVSREYFP